MNENAPTADETNTVHEIDPATLEKRKKHLDLLSAFHYVVGGLAFLFSLFALIYLGLGVGMLVSPETFADGGDPPPAFIGCMMLALGGFILLLGWAYTGLTIYAGRCLSQRRRYRLCMVSAAISCAFSPFGTVLGIFTIIVLLQDGVRGLFAEA